MRDQSLNNIQHEVKLLIYGVSDRHRTASESRED